MKKSYLLGAALMALTWTSCTQDDSLNLVADDSVFTGEMEYVGSRTSLGEDNKISWVMEDELSIFKKNTINRHYKVSSINNGKATFTYLDNKTPNPVASIPANYAVYPYSEDNTITSAGVISAPVPATGYTYENRTSFISSALMASTSTGTNFSFKNVQGYLRLRLCAVIPEDYESAVKSVTLTSTKALSGTAEITFGTDGIPTAEIKENAGYSLTVDLKTPQRLSTKASGNYVELYVPVVPMTFGAGEITLTINFEEGAPFSKANGKAITVARREVTGMMLEIGADEDFTGDIESADEASEVSTAEELAALLTSNKDEISVKLENDIDLPISSLGTMTGGSGEYKLGGENTRKIIIDLNDKRLNVTTTYWSNLGAKNDNALFTIKNGTMTSSQPTGTWNSYDVTFSNCNYVIEKVVFEKAIAFDNTGKSVSLKDVTINETHDYYAMWITAAGQNVTIDGLTINSAGRGIKIDEQYVDTPAKVTLNISNATFKTAKKAAILVKSVAGAEINASNLDISNVAADNGFAVWVDEDAAAYADLVEVNGALKAIEGYLMIASGLGYNETKKEYAIFSAEGLVAMSNTAIKGGEKVVLVSDIDLAGVEFTGLRAFNSENNNTFDGQGHTVSNWAYNGGAADMGFIKSWVGTIKNVNFDNCHLKTGGRSAVVAGNVYANIENVNVNNSSIEDSNWACGIIAGLYNSGNISNCSVINSSVKSNGGTAAIAGVINESAGTRKIENCQVEGTTVHNTGVYGEDYSSALFVGVFNAGNTVYEFNNCTFSNNKVEGGCVANALYYPKAGEVEFIKVNGKIVEHPTGYVQDGDITSILNAKGMQWFANEVNVKKNAFAGKTVQLAADIDLAGIDWKPIGQTGATTFNGVFDGQNYTISNLNVNSEAQVGAHYSSGLFGWVESPTANHGHLKNVKIEGATIVGHHNCGALVGYITQETALVENCHVIGATITCTKANADADGDKAGALIGNATVATPVKDCTATDSTVNSGRDAGQLIGAGREANVTGCSATEVSVSANGTGTGKNVRNEVIGRLL